MPSELLERIDQPATSLFQISGRLWDVQEVLDHIVKQFIKDLAVLHTEGFAPFYADYTRRLAFKGKEIRCNSLQGLCLGILPDGRLVLQLPNGEKHLLSAGEISR
jgi:BirA family biotin operon repressor/biotin-[acetyl-CoA-carboxylase] ligase